MKVRPTGTNIVVKVDTTSDKIGSIIVPVSMRSKSNTGEVLDVAPGTSEELMQIVKSDTIVFPKGQGTKLDENNILLKQKHIQYIK